MDFNLFFFLLRTILTMLITFRGESEWVKIGWRIRNLNSPTKGRVKQVIFMGEIYFATLICIEHHLLWFGGAVNQVLFIMLMRIFLLLRRKHTNV